jgi:GntR family transcriptional regulator
MERIEQKLFKPVNKRSNTPYYIQIKNQIQKVVEDKQINDGHQLLNENLLTEIFDVNRLTLRNALRELDLDGLIERKKGYGTFVSSKKKISYMSQETSFYSDQLKEENLETIVVSNIIKTSSKDIQNKMNLVSNKKISIVERYRLLNNDPIFYSFIYIPVKFCERIEDKDIEQSSIIRIIEEKFDNKIKRIERYLEYVDPKEFKNISEILKLESAEGLFYMQSYLFNDDGLIIAYFQDYLRTSKNKFSFYIERKK